MFGGRMKIMWDEQLVDLPIHYIKSIRRKTTRTFIQHKYANIIVTVMN